MARGIQGISGTFGLQTILFCSGSFNVMMFGDPGRWSYHVVPPTPGNSFIGTPGCSYDRSHRCGRVWAAEVIRLNLYIHIFLAVGVLID